MIYAGPMIDAHHHLWDLGLGKHPWLAASRSDEMVFGDTTPLVRNYLPDDFRGDAARQNLVGSVHIEAGWDSADPVGETRWLDGLAERHGLPTALVVQAPLDRPEAEAARLAARFPDTQIILNHAGSPIDRDAAGMAAWRRGLALLAAQPNVAIKISDLVAYDHHWTIDSLRPVVLACIDAFGADRAMFGSDFPVAGLHATYDQAYDAFKAIVADFSAAEQRKLFHDNAARLYRLAV